ncbi:MAG: sce7725 family protein [Halomonas sp.]|nr:sce7725 family protein [Halomonas sp.]MBP5979772.1 sce7725 family protein [Halomonas sp.]
MYYPILRGKQFELIAIRELASSIEEKNFCPVIEPVRTNTKPLKKTLEVLSGNGIKPLLILNPDIGNFANKKASLDFFSDMEEYSDLYVPCIKVSDINDIESISRYSFKIEDVAVFVAGSIDKNMLSRLVDAKFVFVDREKIHPGALAQLKRVVLYSDSFDKKTRNADYSETSFFSTLHAEWKNIGGSIGFGDYTILSQDYSESGGPAYVVTIHLSYIDEESFDSMRVRHFSSYDDESPANPGGKFKSALQELCDYVEENPNEFYMTSGLSEFIYLKNSSFPGLGHVKKLSMKHHIETTCHYIGA